MAMRGNAATISSLFGYSNSMSSTNFDQKLDVLNKVSL